MHPSRFRLRITVQWPMVATTVTGMATAYFEMGRRRGIYLEMRENHLAEAQRWAADRWVGEHEASIQGVKESHQQWADHGRTAGHMQGYHQKMTDEYEEASLNLWLLVGPDPAAPPGPIRPPATAHGCE